MNDVLEPCVQRPALTRALCLTEVVLGAWISAGTQRGYLEDFSR